MSTGHRDKLIVLATGGTGGHVFPAEALAQELIRCGYRLALVTDRRGGEYGGELGGALGGTLDQIERHTISAAAVTGKGLLGKVKAVAALARGFFQARTLFKRLKPAAVIGFGGYPSAPTMLAASRLKWIKTAIHEQNAVLGRANRLLAPRVNAIAASFARTNELRSADETKVVLTGNPVRPALCALSENGFTAPAETTKVNILVIGGSQGAQAFGELMPNAMSHLTPEERARIALTQQVREEQLHTVKARYQSLGVEVDLASFFDDIPTRLDKAHLVLTRAGASTIAELTTTGRPAILIPYPYAVDDHQTENAARLSDAAGGWMIPQRDATPEVLAARISDLLAQPHTLAAAATAARNIGRPDASEKLADMVIALIGDTPPNRVARPKLSTQESPLS